MPCLAQLANEDDEAVPSTGDRWVSETPQFVRICGPKYSKLCWSGIEARWSITRIWTQVQELQESEESGIRCSVEESSTLADGWLVRAVALSCVPRWVMRLDSG